MDALLKKVTRIPMEELWRPTGSAIGPRIRMLNRSEIAELLRIRAVEFVLANVDESLQWIEARRCFDFWNGEVKSHLVEDGSRIDLDKYPGGYCYVATEWEDKESTSSIVLLERHH